MNEDEEEKIEMAQPQNNGFDTLLKYWPLILTAGACILGYSDLKEKNYRLYLQFDEHKKSHLVQDTERKAMSEKVDKIADLLASIDKKIDIDRKTIPLTYAKKEDVVLKTQINKQYLTKQ
jgi:hypothetical protein